MRQVLVPFLLLTLLLAPSGPTLAAPPTPDNAVFQVTDVAIDVKADNALHARDQAILEAQHKAFAALLARLGAPPELATKQNDTAIAALVQGFEVQQERVSAVRYLGTFTVAFKPNAVRVLLEKSGVSFSDTRSAPVLVLPMVNTGTQKILWEDRTPWRAAWEEAAHNGGLVPVILPAGDLDDIKLASTEEAAEGKAESLQALQQKYQTASVVVAILNADPAHPERKQTLTVNVTRYDSNGAAEEPEQRALPTTTDAASFTAALNDGVRQIHDNMEKTWRQTNKIATPPPAAKQPALHLPVTVPIATLADWAHVHNKLSSVGSITHTNVIALTRGAANIELEFEGDIPQLQTALKQQNLSLDQSPSTGIWLLQTASP